MKNKFIPFFFLIIFTFISSSFGQETTIGLSGVEISGRGGGYFDYSDPTTINIKVSVWGYIRYPGRYNIPLYTTPTDLLSYAGGPMDGAELDDIRIFRVKEDGTEEIIKLNYDDLINEDKLQTKSHPIVSLKASDIVIIPGGPKYYFRDWLSITLSIFSAIVSLTILILRW